MINHMQLYFALRPACGYEFVDGRGERVINCDLPDWFFFLSVHTRVHLVRRSLEFDMKFRDVASDNQRCMCP